MKDIIAIYDSDPLYVDRFADFVNHTCSIPFTVIAFTKLEYLLEFSIEQSIKILIVATFMDQQALGEVKALQKVLLTDGKNQSLHSEYPFIFKYQAVDRIVKEILVIYCDRFEPEISNYSGKKANVIGVYSPIHRCLKTSFALILGQLMSKECKVLYLNLEEYSGLPEIIGYQNNHSFSDLLYFYQQDKYSQMRLNSLVSTWKELDYIPPISYPEDLCQVEPRELAQLVDFIAGDSVYDTVIIDTGPLSRQVISVLEKCQIIYMPVKNDIISVAKISEFEKYLIHSGREKLLEYIKKLDLPYQGNFGKSDFLEQMMWSQLGDYIRDLMKG